MHHASLALVVLVGCVAPQTSRTSGYPVAAGPAPTPAASTRLTKEQIDAIPNAFPASLVPPRTRAFAPMYESLKQVTPMNIGELISILLILDDVHVPVSVEECGKASAQYDPRTRSIRICYEFIEYANELLGRTGKDLAIVDADTNALLMFATLHEIGHALVDVLDLSVGSNEEDRVDEFAFLAMTNVNDVELARSVVAAPTEFFARHGAAVGTQGNGVHSSGGQRAFDGICMLYGRLREPSAKRVLGDRADACIEQSIRIRDRWRDWLRPYSRVTGGRTF
jgi:hypothetical protein